MAVGAGGEYSVGAGVCRSMGLVPYKGPELEAQPSYRK